MEILTNLRNEVKIRVAEFETSLKPLINEDAQKRYLTFSFADKDLSVGQEIDCYSLIDVLIYLSFLSGPNNKLTTEVTSYKIKLLILLPLLNNLISPEALQNILIQHFILEDELKTIILICLLNDSH